LSSRFPAGLRLVLVLVVGGCGPADRGTAGAATIEVVDDAGARVRLDVPARRILSLIPGRTDAVVALGAGERLIARTRWDPQPSLAHLPTLDNALTPSVEWIVAQAPDLVIAWPDGQARSVVTRMRELGIPVYASAVETLAQLDTAIAELGVLLGIEARADSLRAGIVATIDSVRAAVADAEPIASAFLIGTDPPMAAGPGTFIDELMTAAGGRNVFADAPAKWPQVGLEELLARAPRVLIVASGMDAAALLASLRERPGWRDVAAVRDGRVVTVEASEVNQPGPGVIATVRRFAAILHPAGAR
jgi:iron complex transport system substrate-binding protein